jgi:hypothetical protein
LLSELGHEVIVAHARNVWVSGEAYEPLHNSSRIPLSVAA